MIVLTGDTHSDVSRLSRKQNPILSTLTKKDIVCITGDFGLFWNHSMTNEEKYWLNWLTKKPFTTVFLDGNHENFNVINNFHEVDFLKGKAGLAYCSKYGNIYHLKRGEIYTYQNKQIFVFGGAVSTDKESRTKDISWWPEEEAKYSDVSHALDSLEKVNYKVDYILTHTLPKTMIMSMGKYDYAKCATADFLDHIVDTVKFKHWYCGHFHMEKTIGRFTILYKNFVTIK